MSNNRRLTIDNKLTKEFVLCNWLLFNDIDISIFVKDVTVKRVSKQKGILFANVAVSVVKNYWHT